MLDKAVVIRDDRHRFRDLGDVLAVARAEGKKLFRTCENILVIRVFWDSEIGYVAVVRQPGCTSSLVVSGGDKMKSEDTRKARLEG